MKRRRDRNLPAVRTLGQQEPWLTTTALSAGVYGLLTWIVATFVLSSWPLAGSWSLAPIVDLTATFTVINALWGLALIVDLLNASGSNGRIRRARMVGTVLALVLVALGQLALSNMRVAAGG